MNRTTNPASFFRFLIPAVLAFNLTAAAYAQSAPGQIAIAQEPVFQDSITLELATEEWLTTATAKVYLQIVAVFDQKQSGAVRQKVLAELAKVAPGTEWKFTGFNRREGSAGYEQWTINAESRIADTGIDGLRDKLKRASRTGFEVELQNVSYAPSEEEKQDHYRLLRRNIYQMAQKELANLNDLFPKRKYRITELTFSPSALQYQRAQAKTLDDKVLETYRVNRDSGGQQMNVSQLVRLHATLILGTTFLPTKQ
ncbi:hypothetical protein [Emcibacter nanhaiensis]|uniref:DUF541 domain-containing protein n=1 Tax=Emcibacter nanhaiensis TaxID=1505037 RepID=A0A501PBP6_9PROT|nr:hypothetical protein [Emcibacter nanhaiensis]TPD57780.1 hypothetical protein FIV46_16895 [Emcibacter nanhaiensis]